MADSDFPRRAKKIDGDWAGNLELLPSLPVFDCEGLENWSVSPKILKKILRDVTLCLSITRVSMAVWDPANL